MIRFVVGLLIVMGSMGGMENPDNPLLPLVGLAVAGLAVMSFGVRAMNRSNY
jgi:hypothetical protein